LVPFATNYKSLLGHASTTKCFYEAHGSDISEWILMAASEIPFRTEEEVDENVKKMTKSNNAVSLCIIAPFAPLRIAPRRSLAASFSFPDEFVLEEFIHTVIEKYPKKEERPALHLLLHSPGGTLESSYVVARILRNNFNKIVGFIPHIAASGATLIAISCDELVMGDISRLTGIDPHYDYDGGTFYPLSTVRAFDRLEGILGAKTLDEISYPYQHLVQSITAEKYDEATHELKMVEGYAIELMKKAGYNEEQIDTIINRLLYNIESHEEVIHFQRAKDLGLKVRHFSEETQLCDTWKAMKSWLWKYFLKPSPVHFIKHCFPCDIANPESEELKKDEVQVT
jgi:hypothetical protein